LQFRQGVKLGVPTLKWSGKRGHIAFFKNRQCMKNKHIRGYIPFLESNGILTSKFITNSIKVQKLQNILHDMPILFYL